MIEIDVRKVERVSILGIKDRIIRGDGDLALRRRFGELLDAGERRFVLDLRAVPYMDSAAVGEIAACAKRSAEHEATIRLLVEARSRIDDLLRLSALDRIFEVHHDESRALTSLDD